MYLNHEVSNLCTQMTVMMTAATTTIPPTPPRMPYNS